MYNNRIRHTVNSCCRKGLFELRSEAFVIKKNTYIYIYIYTHTHTELNPTITQSATINHLSLYDVPATCFGLYIVTVREVSYKGI